MKIRFVVTAILVFALLFATYNPSGYSFVSRAIDFAQNPFGWIVILIFCAFWGAVLYFVYISTRVVITAVVFLLMGLLGYNVYYYGANILLFSPWVSIGIGYSLMAIGIALCLLWPSVRRSATGIHATSVVETPEGETDD